MVEIVYGQKKDVKQVLEIYKEFFSDSAALEPDYLQEANQEKKFLYDCVKSKTSDLILAKDKDVVLGFIVLNEAASPPYNLFKKRTLCYIMDIAVSKNARSHGIGTLLLKEAESWAKARSLDYMQLNVLKRNTRARELYEKLGYRDVLITMRKEN